MMAPDDRDAYLLDPKMLRLFDVLYNTRSVTRSGDELGWSQPTVSTWLGKLRQYLDDPLFVRTSTGMQPTPRADMLISTCRAALVSLRHLSADRPGFDPATARRTFRLGMTDASHVTLLPRLLARVHSVAPLIRLETQHIGSDTAGMLLSGETDLALGLLPQLDVGFYQQTLYTQDWICLSRADHPRIGTSLSLAAYRQATHVSVASGASLLLLNDALTAAGIERQVLLELPGFLGLATILQKSDLIATLPRMIGEMLGRAGGLSMLDCPVDIPSFEVKQYWHERFHHEGGSQWLRGICAELFQPSAVATERPLPP